MSSLQRALNSFMKLQPLDWPKSLIILDFNNAFDTS